MNYIFKPASFIAVLGAVLLLYGCSQTSDSNKPGNPEIVITGVAIKDYDPRQGNYNNVDVTFNNYLRIKGIQLLKENNNLKLVMPVYVSKNGEEYPQVKLASSEVFSAIRKAIEKQEFFPEKFPATTYRVTKFKKNSYPSKLKYFCSVQFNKMVEIECRIMDHQGSPWIAWPSLIRETEGKKQWIDQIEFIDRETKELIEKELLEKYQTARQEIYGKERE